MYNSIVEKRGTVVMPEFSGERIYMHEFMQSEGLPANLSRWQSVVDDMLHGIKTDQPIYLMVDQTHVKQGQPQRRPGMHVDGYWVVGDHTGGGHRGISAHGGGGHGGGSGRWNGDNGHGSSKHSSGNSGWDSVNFSSPEGIILASNISACAGYIGQYDEQMIGNGGDASLVKTTLDRVVLEANKVYAGNVGFLHESLPVDVDCFRTLVRLNVPGWTPTVH